MSSQARATVAAVRVEVPAATVQPVITTQSDTSFLMAVVGTGELVAEGIMWCGKKMQEQYETARQSFTDLANRELAAQRARPEDRRLILTTMIERFTTSNHLHPNTTSPTLPGDLQAQEAQEQEAITDILRQAQQAFNSAGQANRVKAEHERANIQRLLRDEIAASQGIVAVDKILSANAVLQGSVQDMWAALQMLSAARQQALRTTTDTQVLRTNQAQQAQHILDATRDELTVIRNLLVQSYGGVDQRFSDQIKGIEDMMQMAQRRVNSQTSDYDPTRGLHDAKLVQQNMQRFKDQATATLTEEMEKRQQYILEEQGRLKALDRMVQDALTSKIITASQSNDLQQPVRQLREQSDRMLSGGASRLAIDQLKYDIEQISHTVFQTVGTGQQQEVIDVIATTLSELGFSSDPDTQGPPTISMSGPSLEVSAEREGKKVTFRVDRDGLVEYDFSGYLGQDCLSAGDEIFTALREKGLSIVDEAGLQRLNSYSPEAVTPELLKDSQFAPELFDNKSQSYLSTVIMYILRDRMGFHNLLHSSSAGSVVIQAFNGGLSYLIEVSHEGNMSILKNGADVLEGSGDTLITELGAIQSQETSTDPYADSYTDQHRIGGGQVGETRNDSHEAIENQVEEDWQQQQQNIDDLG